MTTSVDIGAGRLVDVESEVYHGYTGKGERAGGMWRITNTYAGTITFTVASDFPTAVLDKQYSIVRGEGASSSLPGTAYFGTGDFSDSVTLEEDAVIWYKTTFRTYPLTGETAFTNGLTVASTNIDVDVVIGTDHFRGVREQWVKDEMLTGLLGGFTGEKVGVGSVICDFVNQGFTLVDIINWFIAENPSAIPYRPLV